MRGASGAGLEVVSTAKQSVANMMAKRDHANVAKPTRCVFRHRLDDSPGIQSADFPKNILFQNIGTNTKLGSPPHPPPGLVCAHADRAEMRPSSTLKLDGFQCRRRAPPHSTRQRKHMSSCSSETCWIFSLPNIPSAVDDYKGETSLIFACVLDHTASCAAARPLCAAIPYH